MMPGNVAGGCCSYLPHLTSDLSSLTESLNTDVVKAENPDAVVVQEPQGKH